MFERIKASLVTRERINILTENPRQKTAIIAKHTKRKLTGSKLEHKNARIKMC